MGGLDNLSCIVRFHQKHSQGRIGSAEGMCSAGGCYNLPSGKDEDEGGRMNKYNPFWFILLPSSLILMRGGGHGVGVGAGVWAAGRGGRGHRGRRADPWRDH